MPQRPASLSYATLASSRLQASYTAFPHRQFRYGRSSRQPGFPQRTYSNSELRRAARRFQQALLALPDDLLLQLLRRWAYAASGAQLQELDSTLPADPGTWQASNLRTLLASLSADRFLSHVALDLIDVARRSGFGLEWLAWGDPGDLPAYLNRAAACLRRPQWILRQRRSAIFAEPRDLREAHALRTQLLDLDERLLERLVGGWGDATAWLAAGYPASTFPASPNYRRGTLFDLLDGMEQPEFNQRFLPCLSRSRADLRTQLSPAQLLRVLQAELRRDGAA